MKKFIHTLIAIFLSVSFLQAQVSSNDMAYEKGDLSINAGISVGLIGPAYGYYGNRSFPIPITANVSYGFGKFISGGAYIGYLRVNYDDNFNTKYRYGYSSFSFGAQASFHASAFFREQFDIVISPPKLEYYGKVLVGVETYSWDYDGPSSNNFYYDKKGADVVFGPVLGLRYMFSPNVGGYVEAGRGAYGWLTLGLSFKL